MFTIKTIMQKTTNIYQAKRVTIARKGSEAWLDAFRCAKEVGVTSPDYIELVPELLNENMEPIQDECILENGNRDWVKPEDCIAIICEDGSNFMHPDDDRLSGVAYTFIYKGDEVYIMNQNGSTIEVVK